MKMLKLTILLALLQTSLGFCQESISDLTLGIQKAIKEGEIHQVFKSVSKYQEVYPDSSNKLLNNLINISAKEFKEGNKLAAIQLLEETKQIYKDKASVYIVLGQFYWYEFDRKKCAENFKKVLELRPDNTTAKQYLDILFFVPEKFEVPEKLVANHMLVRPITSNDVDLDYRAVMNNIEHLRGVFGPDDDWPQESLTYLDDQNALKKHEEEHSKRVAFTYTVLNREENECLGCVYFIPIHTEEYDAQVFFWVTRDAYEKGYEDELEIAVKNWIKTSWPFSRVVFPGRDMDWAEYEKIQK